jgi:hypothetical protein
MILTLLICLYLIIYLLSINPIHLLDYKYNTNILIGLLLLILIFLPFILIDKLKHYYYEKTTYDIRH